MIRRRKRWYRAPKKPPKLKVSRKKLKTDKVLHKSAAFTVSRRKKRTKKNEWQMA